MKLITIKGTNLSTTVYRGFAKISNLAAISEADTFDQDNNPEGLQRDLSRRHARDAYRYAEGSQRDLDTLRAWPEVLLNVRDPSVVKVTPLNNHFAEIEIDQAKIQKGQDQPQISRFDGNHRLFFGHGDPQHEWPPLEVSTPFSLAVGLSREQETRLFRDINDNQKALNTSHLAHLEARLTPSERLALENPPLWIAEHLSDDPKSPWHGLVHKGGRRGQGMRRRVNLASLRTGVSMTLRDSIKLRSFSSIESKYVYLRVYWHAVKEIYAREWASPRDYLLLRGIGIWTLSMLGAEIIDRCLLRSIDAKDLQTEMEGYLRQTHRVFDWHRTEGNIKGYGGRSGAKEAAELMKQALSDEQLDMGKLEKQALEEL